MFLRFRAGARLATPLAVLLAAAAPLVAQRPVHGTVRDAQSGMPIAGARLEGAGRAAYSDAGGHFTLQLPADTTTVAVSRLGYGTVRLRAAALAEGVALAPQPVLLDAMTVDAEKTSNLAIGTALAVGTVSRDALDEGAQTSLAEAVAEIEGVSVSRMGSWGSRAVVRGLGGERVAVLVDGNRVNRACTFGMDQGLATIDPATVERVEVLSGPGSTLYGSGNLGGVINVVTRRRGASDERAVAGEMRAGATSAIPGGSLGGTLWLRRAGLDASLSADAARYGDYRSPAGTVDGSSFRHATGSGQLGYELTAAQRLSLQGQLYYGRDIGWPSMGAVIPMERRRSASVDYGWQLGRGALDAFSARAFVQRLDHHMQVPMVMTSGAMTMRSLTDARSRSTTSGGRAQFRLLPSAATHLDVGVEATEWAAEATRWTERSGMGGQPAMRTTLHTWPAVRVLDVGAFAQGEWRLSEAVAASAGARLDRVARRADGWESTRDRVATGNLGVRAGLGAGFGARASLGMGYRIPDPTELFGLAIRPDGFLYRGNPELETETNRNLEATLAYDVTVLSLSLTAFRNDLNDMIAPVLVPGDTAAGLPVRSYANLDRARLTGGSASASWRPSAPLQLRGVLSYTRGEDRETGAALPQMPPLEGTLALRLLPGRLVEWVEVEGRAGARQTRAARATGELETPGFGVIDLRSGFSLAGADVAFGVENLLDRAFREHLDPARLSRPGRNLYVKLVRGF